MICRLQMASIYSLKMCVRFIQEYVYFSNFVLRSFVFLHKCIIVS